MTASMPVTDTKSLEQRVIEEMKMKSFQFTGSGTVKEHDFDEELVRASDEQVVRQLEQMTEERAVLIYCDEQLAWAIRRKAHNAYQITATTPHEFIRKLDDKHEGSDKYYLCYTTDKSTMRGYDYRAPKNGINLVIAQSVVTQRDFHQALVRVGRQGDKCKRYSVKGVPRINKDQNNELQQFMFKFLSERHPIKKDQIRMPKPNPGPFRTTQRASLAAKRQVEAANNQSLTQFFKTNQYQQKDNQ